MLRASMSRLAFVCGLGDAADVDGGGDGPDAGDGDDHRGVLSYLWWFAAGWPMAGAQP